MNDAYLSQTFKLKTAGGNDGYYITSVDLYFVEKDSDLGVSIEIHEVTDGVPTIRVLPDARAWLPATGVSVSSTAATPTTFTFDTPVYVRADVEYAIMMIPDGLSPSYKVWTAITGQGDVTNTSLINNKNWGDGTLFYSTSGSAWTPVQDEDLKFSLKVASFTTSTGTTGYVNDDYEFLTLSNISGSFKGGESIAQLSNAYSNGTIVTSNTSTTITGTGTLFTGLVAGDKLAILYANTSTATLTGGYVSTSGANVSNSFNSSTFTNDYVPGSFVRFSNTTTGEIRQVVSVTNNTFMVIDAPLSVAAANVQLFKVDVISDVSTVRSVANNTSITVDRYGKLSGTASYARAVSGVISVYNPLKSKLVLTSSTSANSNFLFRASNSTYLGTIISDVSQAQARVSSIDNVKVSYMLPMINKRQPAGTLVKLNAGVFDDDTDTIGTEEYSFSTKIKTDYNGLLRSKTNEINGTTITKSLQVTLPLESKYTYSSPAIDVAPASIVTQTNIINNDLTNENTRYGNAYSRYISKNIVLADGLEAEDAIVYLTAYKPQGTNIKVAVRLLNGTDSERLSSKQWTFLEQETPDVYSSSLNENDRREYKFVLPFTPTNGGDLPGFASGSTVSTTLDGFGTSWNTSLVSGDYIMVIRNNDRTDYAVRRVTATPTATAITMDSVLPFSASSLIVRKVTNIQQAFKYNQNGYIARYYSADGSAYDTYKYMAVKIILLAPTHYSVPFVDDVRAICTTV